MGASSLITLQMGITQSVNQNHCMACIGSTMVTDLIFAGEVVIFTMSLYVPVLGFKALHKEAKLYDSRSPRYMHFEACLIGQINLSMRVPRALRNRKALHILIAWYIAAGDHA